MSTYRAFTLCNHFPINHNFLYSRANFENRVESGSAFAVYHRGEKVCDLWGGWANVHDEQPWTEKTMTAVESVTKSVAAITIAHLCDR